MNDLDDLLAADASAWRQHVDTTLTGGATDVSFTLNRSGRSGRSGRRGRRWHARPLLSAAAVAVLVLVTTLLVATRGDGGNHVAARQSASTAGPTPRITVGSADAKQPSLGSSWSRTRYPLAHPISAAQTHGLVSMLWRLNGIDDARRSLAIQYVLGGCRPGWVYLHETASSVLIEAVSQPSEECGDILKNGTATIQLRQPLGNRRLLHAKVRPGWDNPKLLLRIPR
jgi:hypothetical protein